MVTMSPPLTIIPVAPIGTYMSRAFVDGRDASGKRFGGIREMAMNEYATSPQGAALRKVRIAMDVTIRVAAGRAGTACAEYCRLEQGELQLSAEDWKRLTKAVLGVP
jgi:hypothetical protein